MPPHDLDPFLAELTRRGFLRRAGATGFALSSASLLAACGGIEGESNNGGSKGTAEPKEVTHAKTALDELNISNWPLYIDKKVNKDFVKEFDVAKFKYIEDINENEGFFGKIRQPLASGQDIGRDIVVLTDWMAARMVNLGYLEPIDKKNIPNAENLQPALQSPEWDPERTYSLPWQSGMTGIGYDISKTGGEITSYDQLFSSEYKGQMSMFNDARDATNFILLWKGTKPEDATVDDVLAAVEELDKLNRSGQIRRFTGNDYVQELAKGNLVLSQAYSGDVIQLNADNPNLRFAIPEEGATLWTDNMLIPAKARNPYAAEVYMNHVYDPVVAAKIAAYVNYVTPVVGAKEELIKQDPKTADNQLIFPSEETLANLHPFVNLTEEEETQVNEAFQAVVGA